jgi:NADH-quinone oxidoreductase subunit L
MHHEQDMRRMGGLKKYMPITFATMLTGWLAISGIPIFAGFFSKDEILWKVWSAGLFSLPNPVWSKVLWFIAALTALLTAIYMTRMMVMTFWGTERFREQHEDYVHTDHTHAAEDSHHHGVHEPHESPWTMTVPLVVLAVLSTVGGFIGIPYALGSFFSEHPVNYIEQTLEPAISHVPAGASPGAETNQADSIEWLSPKPQATDAAPPVHSFEGAEAAPGTAEHATGTSASAVAEHAHSPEEISQERLLALVSVLIAACGIGAGWVLFKKRPLLQMPSILEHKYYVDEIYDFAIINPIHVVSREALWKLFDQGVIDGILHSIGDAVTESGRLLRHLQAGFLRGYAAIILVGALAIIGFFAYIGFNLTALVR